MVRRKILPRSRRFLALVLPTSVSATSGTPFAFDTAWGPKDVAAISSDQRGEEMVWMGFPALLWLAVFLALIAVGLLSQMGDCWRCHGECQLAFVLMMSVVGFMTIISLRIGSGDWLIGCLTIMAMAVCSSMNVSARRRAPVF